MKNGFRSKLPVMYNKINTEKYNQLEDKLSFLKAAALPKDILQQNRDLEQINKFKIVDSTMTEDEREKIFSERMFAKQSSPQTCFSPNVGFGFNKKCSPEKNIDLMKDEAYLRRIKKANYGKWYLTPSKFEKKNQRLNKEVNSHNKE